jgi:UPF0716 protein FxsA
MAGYLLLALILVPLSEIAVFIEVGEALGLAPTLVIVVLTAVAGAALLRRQGLDTLRRAEASLARGEAPVAEVFDGLCLLLAGALLLTPGFVTDAVGGLLFLPALRAWLRLWALKRLLSSGRVWVDGTPVAPGDDRPPDDVGGPLIEGDFAELGGETPEAAEPPPPVRGESKWGRGD